jgi:hypothetical protein
MDGGAIRTKSRQAFGRVRTSQSAYIQVSTALRAAQNGGARWWWWRRRRQSWQPPRVQSSCRGTGSEVLGNIVVADCWLAHRMPPPLSNRTDRQAHHHHDVSVAPSWHSSPGAAGQLAPMRRDVIALSWSWPALDGNFLLVMTTTRTRNQNLISTSH